MAVFIWALSVFTSDLNHSIDTTGQTDSFAIFANFFTFSNSGGAIGGTFLYIGSLRGVTKVTKSAYSIAIVS